MIITIPFFKYNIKKYLIGLSENNIRSEKIVNFIKNRYRSVLSESFLSWLTRFKLLFG